MINHLTIKALMWNIPSSYKRLRCWKNFQFHCTRDAVMLCLNKKNIVSFLVVSLNIYLVSSQQSPFPNLAAFVPQNFNGLAAQFQQGLSGGQQGAGFNGFPSLPQIAPPQFPSGQFPFPNAQSQFPFPTNFGQFMGLPTDNNNNNMGQQPQPQPVTNQIAAAPNGDKYAIYNLASTKRPVKRQTQRDSASQWCKKFWNIF